MKQRIGSFDVDIVRAEQPKFAAPLLLLHGLWSGPWIWQRFASFCSHRGWSSYAPLLRVEGVRPQWEDMSAELSALSAHLDERPVVIGHDLGALLALLLPEACAAAALSPLLPGPAIRRHPVFAGTRARWAHFRRQRYCPSPRRAAAYLGLPASAVLVAEPSEWVERIADMPAAVFRKPRRPALVVAGGADPGCAPDSVESFAGEVGADYVLLAEGDHGLPYGAAWQATASLVHRWIVRRLGESLLLLRGDEDLRDE